MKLDNIIKGKRPIQVAIFLLATTTFINSCKKVETDLGVDVLPSDDQLNVQTDTFAISSYSMLEDSLRSDELSNNMLGSYNDPTFGEVNASIYTQIRLSTFNPTFDVPNTTVDSVVLSLNIAGHYGNETPQTFSVFQLTENLIQDSAYYTNSVKTNNGIELVDPSFSTFTPSLTNEPVIDGNTLDPQIRIRLINSFGDNIIAASLTGDLASDTSFNNLINGIYINVNNPSQAIDEGGIYYLDMTHEDTKITIYYHDLNDTSKFEMPINSNCARFTHIEHDYSASEIAAQVADSTLGNTFYYLQAGAGVISNIMIDNILDLQAEGNIIINKAELFLPVQHYSVSPYAPPVKIIAFGIDETGEIYNMPDFLFPGSSVFGGNYDDVTKAYKFNMVRYIQDVVSGNLDNNPIRLTTTLSSVSTNRVILSGKNSPNREKPYLKVYYTKY